MDSGYVNNQLNFDNAQQHVLISDRNLLHDGIGSGCSSGVTPVRQINGKANIVTSLVKWIDDKDYGHGKAGGVALLDGSVSSINQAELKVLFRSGDDNGSVHFMFPQ
jgi:hypothetical protein